jgi:hypothetical protein
VKVSFDRIGHPLYCDIGPNAGDMLIGLKISLYLSPEEYARYEGTQSLQITLSESGGKPLRAGNTAEPSGEVSVGDLVCVGEAPLVCKRAGWAPLRGGITEARVDEHGTHPLPLPGEPDAPPGGKADPPHPGPHPGITPSTVAGDPATPGEGIPAVDKISGR